MEGSTGDGGVRIVSRRIVRPEPASSPDGLPETMHLTPWDLRLINLEYIKKGVLLPKPPPRTSGVGLVDGLASFLARALARFYPLAGRLTATAGVPGGLAISLRCNGDGAELVHAVAPDVTVSDIATPLYVPPVVRSFFPFNGVQGVEAVLGSRPVLAAQVTELADGIFVAMSLNHGVADGTTFWHLFNTWSEISRRSGGGGGVESYDDLSTPPPVLDRWFPDTSFPVPIHLPFVKVEDMVQPPEYTPVQECLFHFSAESLKKLKAKANAEMAGTATATISSLQSLLAHEWRAACRARRLAPHLENACSITMGCRARVKGVPRDYVGNAVVRAAARSAVGDVLDRGLGWAAWLLNCAVASFDEAKVRDDLASWAQKPELAYARLAWNPACTLTAGSPRFNVYGNDFGWGRPVGVRSGAENKMDGKVTVYEGCDGGGGMALEVCLFPEVMSRLVADEEFMEAVTIA